MKKVAALVSGGMDSIYATYDRALHSGDQITVVHFNFGTCPEFIACMRWAAQGAANWMSANVRPVEFLEVQVDQYWNSAGQLRQTRANGWWATELIFWAAERCSAGQFDEVFTGWCGENFSPNRAMVLRRLQKAIFARYASRGTLTYPIEQVTKAESFVAMPPELRSFAMSCGDPKLADGRPVACGVCRKCVRNITMIETMKSGLPLREVRKRHLEKIAVTPDHNGAGYREVYPDFELWNLLDEPRLDDANKFLYECEIT
jgi:7-cyano-7-deazaguanine synthase in queuosine biosynthesis